LEKDLLYLVDLSTVKLDETDGVESSWVHALPAGEYVHPVFGPLSMTAEKINGFAESVKAKVRGIDPSINFSHGVPGSDGDGVAAGWVKDAEARANGLWLFVEWVKDAAAAIKDKKWRYFSAEFRDKWKDPTGKEHKNVLFGGGLTNRPFMKNLLPINLSEPSIQYAFELVEAIERAKKETQQEGQEMDLVKFAELLGLPAGSTEETVLAKVAELKGAPPTVKPTVPTVNLSEELKRLAEDNPLVKGLIDTVDAQNIALNGYNIELREASVSAKLAEFDKSKIVLTAKAKDLVHDLAMDMPTELSERFWELMAMMRNSTGTLVELGERAGTSVRYGRSKDPKTRFMDEVTKVAAEQKIQLNEAMDKVARDQPDLYEGYRQESFAFRE
jgi:hypothetical protein